MSRQSYRCYYELEVGSGPDSAQRRSIRKASSHLIAVPLLFPIILDLVNSRLKLSHEGVKLALL